LVKEITKFYTAKPLTTPNNGAPNFSFFISHSTYTSSNYFLLKVKNESIFNVLIFLAQVHPKNGMEELGLTEINQSTPFI